MYSWKQIRSGVTLVELLLSIAILGILGSVVILAINPTRQIGQANDAADTVNMSNVRSALNQYFAESTGYPTAITTSLQMICAEGYIDASCISLEGIITPVYIAEIPQKNSVNPPYSGYYVAIGDGGDVYLTTSLPTPEPRRAYAFDGVNDSIPIATLSDASPMTFTFWAKNSVGNSRAFISNRIAGGRYFLGLSGTTQMFFFNNSGTPQSHLSTPITPNNGAWHHYAYVLGPNYVHMYFNNTLVYSGSTVLSKIGSRQFVLANDSNGNMATHMFDVRIYTGALLPTNIQHIYSFGASGTNPQVSNILGWYKADDTNATVAYDSSGLGRHGTKTNITPATFHYQGSDVPYSFQNTVGFNFSDTLGYIPRNESNILYDVLGTLLQFSGF